MKDIISLYKLGKLNIKNLKQCIDVKFPIETNFGFFKRRKINN